MKLASTVKQVNQTLDQLSVQRGINAQQVLPRQHHVQRGHTSTMYSNLIALPVQLVIFATVQVQQVPPLQLYAPWEVLVPKQQKLIKEYCVHLDTGSQKQVEPHVSHAQLAIIVMLLG